ncbi:MAG: amidohydrolase [Gammaproteobacteria bacterium]|nr:amidohydrolase [Gammaproteobacteria bacterium]
MSRERIAIDAWATYVSPEGAKRWPAEFIHIFKKYKSPRHMTEGQSVEDLLKEMDESGVDRLILSSFYYKGEPVMTNEEVAAIAKQHPDRFVPAGTVNIMKKPMQVAADIERLVNELGMCCVRLEPYMYGDGMTGLPPNDKHYWPVYMKCSELNVAVALQVGHTGPLLPSECGRPIYLDEVALAFPDLTLIGCHLGQPWHEEMMTLAWKHPNVYVETSARGPRQWPASFVDYTKSWGQDKVIWATDYPLLSFDRTLTELEDLGLSKEIYRKVVRDNLLRALKLDI